MRKLTINTESTEIFGNLDALDEDPAFFRNCFYATKAFEKLKRKKRLMIVVGEKGTGKSALFRMAAMEDDESEDTFAVEAKYLKIDDKADISQKIQGWKEYLSQRIVEKISKKEQARGNLGRKVTEGIGLLASAIGDAVKTKYGIDYAIRKDNSEMPPRYLVFFKAPDVEAFNAAFKEYSASLRSKTKRPSVLEKLHELVQAAAELPGKVRRKEQERGL